MPSREALSELAMGLITMNIGAHLSYHRIHNALRRIITRSLMEGTGGVVLGVITAATAPGTTLALVRETRDRGPFVKTLLSVVAGDNILCICLFALLGMLLADYYAKEKEPIYCAPSSPAPGPKKLWQQHLSASLLTQRHAS